MNQDTYLAEIITHSGGEPLMVRLIDEYPNLESPLPVDRLTAEDGTTLRVRRDALCDMPYQEMQLRTAPGDPMAILPERLGYQPQLERMPGPSKVVACYRTVRR